MAFRLSFAVICVQYILVIKMKRRVLCAPVHMLMYKKKLKRVAKLHVLAE